MARLSMVIVFAAAGWLVACDDQTPVSIPLGDVPAHAASRLSCVASVRAHTIGCIDANGAAAFRANIIGGQGTYVALASSDVAFDTLSGAFSAAVSLQNLLPYALGTDGVNADTGGIKVFFEQGPVATAGTGVVYVGNADGEGTFTATDQPFFRYPAPLVTGAVTEPRTWIFYPQASVTEFRFSLYVQARVPPTAFRVTAPQPSDTVRGDSVTVRVVGPPPGIVVRAVLGRVEVTLAYADSGRWEGRLPVAGLSPGTQALWVEARTGGTVSGTTVPFELPGVPGEPSAVSLGEPSAVSDNGVIAGTDDRGWPFRWSEAAGREPLTRIGRRYRLTGISPNGRFIVGSTAARAGRTASYLWSAGEGVRLITGGTSPRAAGVNDDGIVAGDEGLDGPCCLFRWTAAGGMDILQDTASGAAGITASGAVIGQYSRLCEPDRVFIQCSILTAMLWTAAGAVIPDDQEGGLVRVVHASGFAAGLDCGPEPFTGRENCYPTLWRATPDSLAVVGGWSVTDEPWHTPVTYVRDVNGAGMVVGYYEGDDGVKHAFRGTRTTYTELDPLGDISAIANSINEAGDVTGCTFGPAGSHAVVWNTDGTAQHLPALEGDDESCGTFIDDARTVVGTSQSYRAQRVARWPRVSGPAAVQTRGGTRRSR